MASGYARALRSHVVDQQEEVKRALSMAWHDVERDLRASEARFQELVDSSPVGIAISVPSGLIIQTNRALAEILDSSPDELLGRYLSELCSPGDRAIVEEHCRRLVTSPEPPPRVRVTLRRADGDTVWVYLDGSVLRDAEQSPRHLLMTVEDITNLHLLEQQLHHQSLHDPQTELPNRRYFATHLEQVLARVKPSAVITLLHLDLDGFSTINDGLGRHAGDHALGVVTRRLEGVLADQPSMLARLGSDEFAIVIEPGDSALDVAALVETINTELAEPFYLNDTGVALTATIGVVQRRAAECTPEELMRQASTTLRQLRHWGTRQWALFDPELGMLSHDQCVHAAEQTGAVHDAGQWLLRTAAQRAMSWRRRLGAGIPRWWSTSCRPRPGTLTW